jgi:hypothetical protein
VTNSSRELKSDTAGRNLQGRRVRVIRLDNNNADAAVYAVHRAVHLQLLQNII